MIATFKSYIQESRWKINVLIEIQRFPNNSIIVGHDHYLSSCDLKQKLSGTLDERTIIIPASVSLVNFQGTLFHWVLFLQCPKMFLQKACDQPTCNCLLSFVYVPKLLRAAEGETPKKWINWIILDLFNQVVDQSSKEFVTRLMNDVHSVDWLRGPRWGWWELQKQVGKSEIFPCKI